MYHHAPCAPALLPLRVILHRFSEIKTECSPIMLCSPFSSDLWWQGTGHIGQLSFKSAIAVTKTMSKTVEMTIPWWKRSIRPTFDFFHLNRFCLFQRTFNKFIFGTVSLMAKLHLIEFATKCNYGAKVTCRHSEIKVGNAFSLNVGEAFSLSFIQIFSHSQSSGTHKTCQQ